MGEIYTEREQHAKRESYTKQELFERPTAAELRRDKVVCARGGLHAIARYVAAISPGESLCIRGGLLNDMSARYYKKHAPVIDITAAPGATPRKRLEYALARSRTTPTSGYGWIGAGEDRRLRVVPLVKLLEGARLFAYESKKTADGSAANTLLYDGTPKAQQQGGIAVVDVSRRTTKQELHRIVLSGIPVDENSGWDRVSTHSSCCDDNLFGSVRYASAWDPDRKIFCAHEIAGYWKAAAALYRKHGSKAAARQSPFVAPSQQLVDFYVRLSRHTYVEERDGRRLVRRLPNEAEMEKLLITYARDHPFGACFSNRGKLAERKWATLLSR